MPELKKIAFVLLFLNFSFLAFAEENSEIDSLKQVLERLPGKEKSEILNKLAWKLRNSNPLESVKYGEEAVKLSKKYKLYEELAAAYSFTGVAFRNLGNYKKAFENYFNGLKVSKQHKLELSETYSLINIGNLYIYQKSYPDAKEYLFRALKLSEKIENNSTLAYTNLNLGRAFLLENKPDTALNHFNKALKIRKKDNDPDGSAVCMKYIGDTYLLEKKLNKAQEMYLKALNTLKTSNDNDLLSDIYTQTAKLFILLKNYDNAESFALNAVNQAEIVNSKLRLKNAYSALAEIYKKKGNHKLSSDCFEKIIIYNDSLYNENLTQAISNIKFSAEQEKKQAEINLLKKEKKLKEKDIQQRKQFQNILIVILLILVGIVIYTIITRQKLKINNLKLEKQKKKLQELNHKVSLKSKEVEQRNSEIEIINEQLTDQKNILEKQNKDITDSINYAQTIQHALLTQKTLIDKFLPADHFLFFLPKETVSGDFYYVNKQNDCLYFTVADCTGHGVPGGFLTILGITYLHEIIRRQETNNPAEALTILRRRIKNIFKSVEKDNKNGMDMALCVLNTKTHHLQFAGAYNPLWIVRNNQLLEFKATPNPIGFYPREKEFKKHDIQLQNGDKIYLFSDGYKDQFGGITKRKFMNRRLKELILENNKKPMREQKEILLDRLIDWQAGYKQVDDIAILGFTYEFYTKPLSRCSIRK